MLRMDVPPHLARTPCSTNAIESMISICRERGRNVKSAEAADPCTTHGASSPSYTPADHLHVCRQSTRSNALHGLRGTGAGVSLVVERWVNFFLLSSGGPGWHGLLRVGGNT